MDLKITFLTSGTGTWSITSQFMVSMITERAINQISQTARTATHDAPWSFLFLLFQLWNIYCLDDAERPQPNNLLSFMPHELIFLGYHLQILSYPYSLALRIPTVVKFYNHVLRLRYGYILMRYCSIFIEV